MTLDELDRRLKQMGTLELIAVIGLTATLALGVGVALGRWIGSVVTGYGFF